MNNTPATRNPPSIPDVMPAHFNFNQNLSMHSGCKVHSSPHFISAAAQSNMTKYAARILMLLYVAVSPAYAKSEGPHIKQSQNAQHEKQFNTELFSKCNVCHKPFESTVIGSRTIPSYTAMSGMGQDAIKNGIEHGGHLSSADKSRIYSVLHPAAEPRQAMKKVEKRAEKKARKTRKHGKSKRRK